MSQSPVHELSRDECWELLRSNEFGRLAFHLMGEVHIVPINYASDHEVLLFRTSQGNKLLGVVMQSDVAFEIDGYARDEAWSVIVRGGARVLEKRDDRERAENSRLRSPDPDRQGGLRRDRPGGDHRSALRLDKPWEHAIPVR
ncbi:pyridoxamine 5'-phosphate oxidase family protein [Janibacter limosus]|uniref:Pyridoxamine 5'-phosphate oxidase family protein n=1 Tax=Janibacter limosus TaxID=53458 RepID=A0AC61U7R5_9MICO|nr:pyridoxamine 5'-phosphate oxidase family protein [Janibacter limosus]UUZ46009.1 pyridoxamine 5'-phosphate oxidase family protein [Janibacter limosus]